MKREEELINRYLHGHASEEEIAELDALLKSDPEIRALFYQHSNVASTLREEFGQALPVGEKVVPMPKSFNLKPLALAASLVAVLGILAISLSGPKPVATLVSNENAAWESALPTIEGSQLTPGKMTLKSGVATIRFKSGAELTMEAPAQIILETAMKGKLFEGSAVLQVPESAQGFILETPQGYAVDHGTSFAVSIGKEDGEASFEVLDGEISLHSPGGEALYLKESEAASLVSGAIVKADGPLEEGILAQSHQGIRIETLGKTASAIRSNEHQYLHPDFLMVKKSKNRMDQYDRSAVLAFSMAVQDLEKATGAKLRLNLVPCGLGYASRLPKFNRFAIYGLPRDSEFTWGEELQWKDLPWIKHATLLGNFEVPRSQERGAFTVETQELLQFLKAHPGRDVTFRIVRETSELQGSGLVHAFASDSHPEASGPTLELTFENN